MTRVYVSIGSNIDRENMVRFCISILEQSFSNLEKSSVYESIAVGFSGENFFNMVVRFDAEDPQIVMKKLREIEKSHGRDRHEKKFSPRTLDLDLLLFGDMDLRDRGFDVPREEISRYAFVLGPLAELAPEEIHPTIHKSFADMWSEYCVEHPTEADSIWPITFHW